MPYWLYISSSILTISYIGQQQTVSSLSTFTFNYTFSSANSNRYLITAIVWVSGGPTLSSVSIGGVSATQIGSVIGVTGAPQLAFFYAVVPTNTTQTVVVKYSGNIPEAAAGLWDLEGVSILNASLTPSTSYPFSTSLNVPAGGAVLGASWPAATGATSNTWVGITKDFDSVVSLTRPFTGAHDNFAAANPSLTVSDTPNGSPGSQSSGAIVFSP